MEYGDLSGRLLIVCTSERASQLGYIETKCAPQSDTHVGFLKSVLSGYFAIAVQEIIAKNFHELLITLFQTAHILHPPQARPVLFCSVIMSHHFLEAERPQTCASFVVWNLAFYCEWDIAILLPWLWLEQRRTDSQARLTNKALAFCCLWVHELL